MTWWQRLWRRQELETRLDAELRFHFDRLVADGVRAGLSEAEARRRARLVFGGLEQIRDDCRDARGTRWVETTLQDLRYAVRLLRRSPTFAAVAVLSLALGIGVNTAIFSVMDALLLRNLPVARPEQLVLFGTGRTSGVMDDFPSGPTEIFSQPFFERVRANRDVFSELAAFETMMGEGHVHFSNSASEREPVTIRLVSGNYFAMLGVRASAGRLFTSQEDQAPGAQPVAVMSDRFWQQRFARSPAVIGSTLAFNNTVFTIAGVAPAGFFGTEVGEAPNLWIPLAMQRKVQPWFGNPTDPMAQSLWLMARLKPGVTPAQAQTAVNVWYHQWLQEIAGPAPTSDQLQDMRRARIELTRLASGTSHLRRRFAQPITILMAIVALVLLIACANISNLLLARAADRRREVGLRLALGVARGRLLRQLLSESTLLALTGGALALAISWIGGRLLLSMVSSGPTLLPLDVRPHAGALLFTLALSVATGLIFGIVPALHMTRLDPLVSLRQGKGAAGRSAGGAGPMLVSAQMALALLLVTGAGLFLRTLQKLEHAYLGFDKDRVLQVELDASALPDSGIRAVYSRVEDRVRSLPGVQAVSYSMLTFNQGTWTAPLWPEGVAHTEANSRQNTRGNRVDAEYFDAMGMPILLGRGFGPQDTPGSPRVAVVNESFARQVLPGVSPLGKHFYLASHADVEVIGVARDARYESVRENQRLAWFLFNGQEKSNDGFNNLVIRVAGSPQPMSAQLRSVIRAENPDLLVSNVATLAELVDDSFGQQKWLAKLAAFFGLAALLLASLGIYGVIAYSVARRTGEIGIRMALGARPARVATMVLKELGVLTGAGLALGIAAEFACGKLVASQLYGVEPTDGSILALATVVLAAVAFTAGLIPARRAARLDPVAALKCE